MLSSHTRWLLKCENKAEWSSVESVGVWLQIDCTVAVTMQVTEVSGAAATCKLIMWACRACHSSTSAMLMHSHVDLMCLVWLGQTHSTKAFVLTRQVIRSLLSCVCQFTTRTIAILYAYVRVPSLMQGVVQIQIFASRTHKCSAHFVLLPKLVHDQNRTCALQGALNTQWQTETREGRCIKCLIRKLVPLCCMQHFRITTC